MLSEDQNFEARAYDHDPDADADRWLEDEIDGVGRDVPSSVVILNAFVEETRRRKLAAEMLLDHERVSRRAARDDVKRKMEQFLYWQ